MTDFPYRDRNDHRNGPDFHTGKTCVEPGCDNPAGTWWSPIWCFQHNVERMDRINLKMQKVKESIG